MGRELLCVTACLALVACERERVSPGYAASQLHWMAYTLSQTDPAMLIYDDLLVDSSGHSGSIMFECLPASRVVKITVQLANPVDAESFSLSAGDSAHTFKPLAPASDAPGNVATVLPVPTSNPVLGVFRNSGALHSGNPKLFVEAGKADQAEIRRFFDYCDHGRQ